MRKHEEYLTNQYYQTSSNSKNFEIQCSKINRGISGLLNKIKKLFRFGFPYLLKLTIEVPMDVDDCMQHLLNIIKQYGYRFEDKSNLNKRVIMIKPPKFMTGDYYCATITELNGALLVSIRLLKLTFYTILFTLFFITIPVIFHLFVCSNKSDFVFFLFVLIIMVLMYLYIFLNSYFFLVYIDKELTAEDT